LCILVWPPPSESPSESEVILEKGNFCKAPSFAILASEENSPSESPNESEVILERWNFKAKRNVTSRVESESEKRE
jgi:hypothetical protein